MNDINGIGKSKRRRTGPSGFQQAPGTSKSDSDLIDCIYDAAVVPSLWTGRGVLDLLAKAGDCTDAVFFAVNKKGLTAGRRTNPVSKDGNLRSRELGCEEPVSRNSGAASTL
ncbi:hypothetical protein [Mesorhizobium sp. M0323]|uniref:hypothetical protein n=1 Tax=Mesorhizobium sp. M0323 TaxID=2956938 RepID=UPI00333CD2FE